MEDRHLAARAAEGDHEAFTLLVERYRGYVYTIAYRVVLNEDDALDISQNVFARMFERIGKFDGRGAFKGWLATMTARMAIDFTRRPARRETATEPQALDGMRDRRDDRNAYAAREALESEQRRQMIEESMSDLSPQQRAIFALRFFEEMKPKEIAERLSLTSAQVRSQLARAVARIRESLAEEIV